MCQLGYDPFTPVISFILTHCVRYFLKKFDPDEPKRQLKYAQEQKLINAHYV